MNLRSGKKYPNNATMPVALGVLAAEAASYLYFLYTPWILSPGDRSLYTSAVFNTALCFLVITLVEKSSYFYLQKPKDVVFLSVWLTALHMCIQGPYIITWYNPLSYIGLFGPAAHALVITTAMASVIFYFKNRK